MGKLREMGAKELEKAATRVMPVAATVLATNAIQVAEQAAAAARQTISNGAVNWVAPPMANPSSGQPMQVCSVHGKRRTLPNLRINEHGQWQCVDNARSVCKGAGGNPPDPNATQSGGFICCVHGKRRSEAYVRPNGP